MSREAVLLKTGGKDSAVLAAAPVGTVWNVAALRAISKASRRDAAWVRTAREVGEEEGP